jgi:ring-1,2-phenylacetyl-CoA epoxidase subunit PaaA
LRQEFIDETVPELLALGLTIPDPELRLDEATGHWHIGPINWDEFWQVVKGNGPLNKERLAARQKAHEDGLWVREALTAYAERPK